VLDIGTGTGLLAMLSARAAGFTDTKRGVQHGADDQGDPQLDMGAPRREQRGADAQRHGRHGGSATVIACEVFPPMAALAERLIEHNGLASQIRVVGRRSDELVVWPAAAGLSSTPQNWNVSTGLIRSAQNITGTY
jgi:hypothetical protein